MTDIAAMADAPLYPDNLQSEKHTHRHTVAPTGFAALSTPNCFNPHVERLARFAPGGGKIKKSQSCFFFFLEELIGFFGLSSLFVMFCVIFFPHLGIAFVKNRRTNLSLCVLVGQTHASPILIPTVTYNMNKKHCLLLMHH